MVKRLIVLLCLGGIALCSGDSCRGAEPPTAPIDLEVGFRNPPDEARPSAYWLWLNGYVNRSYVETELKALHAAGIRGLCIFDMGAGGPADTIPPAGPAFMSDESVADIAHAVGIAKRLGMEVELSVASSWDMGGSWVEPKHASMGLFQSEIQLEGPAVIDEVLPFPPVPAKAPLRPDGMPVFYKDIAILALPAGNRLPGYDFIFKIGRHTLDHAVLHNALSDNPKKYGDLHLFAKDFSIAVSTTTPTDDAFHEVLHGTLKPVTGPQPFDLPAVEAEYVRLRILTGHNPDFDRIQLGEFEVFSSDGVNVVASHVADRNRDGAELLGYPPAMGPDKYWSAANLHDGSTSGAAGCWCSAGPPPLMIEDPATIIDLTDHVGADGRLRWAAPAGKWTIVRYACMNTGERLKVPSPNSDGLATDHFSAEATKAFLGYLIDRLESKLGKLDDTALKHLYLASYEVRGQIWTPDMFDRFRQYRGYDMTPFLPTLSGNIVCSDTITQRFIFDYRKTLGDLLVDAYYRAAVDVAHEAGIGVESEAGGPGPPIHQVPVDALKALGALDEVRGEFWPKRPDAHRLWVVKETACAAHTYGKRLVHMEAFTSMYHWEDGPFELKPSADRAFCEGMNHVVWHTGAHQPPEAGKPGWVYGAGTHLNTNLVWWPKAKAFLDYLARCSHLLQQGHFVADVCYYYGDQGYNFVPPKYEIPGLGPGRDYDVVNAEVILTRMSARDGRITLPDGMGYELLVLPERDDIDLAVLRKLETLVAAGGTIIGPKPTRSSGLTDHEARDQEVKDLAEKLWGDCDGKTVFEHQYGEGRIIWGRTPQEVLSGRGIEPDFEFVKMAGDVDLDFIHRRTDEVDIYFVRNKTMQSGMIEASFRVSDKMPEIWDPASGDIIRCCPSKKEPSRVRVVLKFAPVDSMFVVFRGSGSSGDRAVIHAMEKDFPARKVDGPWVVKFAGGLGAPDQVEWAALKSWTESEDPGIRYYSGTARYLTEIDIPDDWFGEGKRIRLHLGRLWAVGEVKLNGKSVGVVWKPPYCVDITEAARPGHNQLEVEVANTWSNRLVGDALSPGDAPRYCRTNVTGSGTPRKAWRDVPLHESGLLGPVHLFQAVERSIPVKPKDAAVGQP